MLPVWKQLHDVVLLRSLQDDSGAKANPRVLRAILDNGEKIIGVPRVFPPLQNTHPFKVRIQPKLIAMTLASLHAIVLSRDSVSKAQVG